MITIFLNCLFTFIFTIVFLEIFNLRRFGGLVDHTYWHYKLYSHFQNNHYDIFSEDCLIVSLEGYYEDIELPVITRLPFPGIISKYYIKGYGIVVNWTPLSKLIDSKLSKK
jgi:hypothetical protein